ncbi:uncharacterized protein [Misgurnus anguillicaudatus]|uniref:uncharacterized protein n=1 Tax=Misgurnus anguillicaudatus TaxID=75329 RepID=UPI003CCF1962
MMDPEYCFGMGLLKRFLWIICVFGPLKVSLQDVNVAVGVTGGSVILPCVTSEIEHKLSDINVRWRHNGSLIVFDILHGNGSVENQNSGYKNRAESFPTEYKKGNFSLKLNNLTHTDGGNYLCYILHSSEEVITQLTINESAVHMEEQPTEGNENQARETHSRIIFTVLGVFMLCLVLCITFYIIWKKRSPDRNMSFKYFRCKDRGADANGKDRGADANGKDRGADANGKDRGADANGKDRGADANGKDRGADANGNDRGADANGNDRAVAIGLLPL